MSAAPLLLLLLAQAPAETVEIHLLTMGPGRHLYTGGGHSAIMITRTVGDEPPETQVYNYGDADFHSTHFVLDFARGTITFFLSSLKDLTHTVNEYGVRQGRDIWMQRLSLTEEQKAAVIEHLETRVDADAGRYRFHHLHALCSTKLRDLLDEVTGGAVAAQLKEKPDPYPIRHYADWAFDGHIGAELGSALLMGRMHDGPNDMWTAAFIPTRMLELLQQVEVTDPAGSGARVPLAGPPQVVVQRAAGPISKAGSGLRPIIIGWLLFVILLVLFLLAYVRLPGQPKLAGAWLLVWSILSGLVGLATLVILAISTVPEWRNNELMASMLVTDLALVLPAIRWMRGSHDAGRLLRLYAGVRLAGMIMIFVLRAAGLLIQQPAIFPGVALLGTVCLWMLLRRLHRRQRAVLIKRAAIG